MGCFLKITTYITVYKYKYKLLNITITNAFEKILQESTRKLNKIWLIKSIKFYSTSVKSWLQGNDTEMYSTRNEEKSFVAERFIRTLKKIKLPNM